MKPKKKTSVPIKKGAKKPLSAKPIMLFDKTIVTTKEKTYTTIEDHFQTADGKASFRSTKNVSSRISCQQKMEQNNLSPFSSNGGSVSPRYRKIQSPKPKDEKDRKKSNGKHVIISQKQCQKKKGEVLKRQFKPAIRMTKEQQNQKTYEMLLLKKLNEKKITQMSQQSSLSIPKFSRLQLNVVHTHQAKQPNPRMTVIMQLKHKIREKYKKQLPGLKSTELKFLCSIVLIQRLWRQSKIKNFISSYISPRNYHNVTRDFQRDGNISKLSVTSSTKQLTSQLVRKYNHLNISSQKPQIIEKQCNSTQLESTRKEEKPINLKDLQLSTDLTPQRQAKMINFVECLRDISYFKQKKAQKRSKINVFNLQESLSEKCLMQKFYEKVFKDGENRKSNFQIFSSKKEEKNLERSIELIKTMSSPQKNQIIQIEERLETQLQENDQAHVERVSVSVQTETSDFVSEEKGTSQISTLKQLSIVSQGVIFMLLNEFSEEFYSFTSRTILRRKKKARLPGLSVTSYSIRQYLTGLSSFMLQNYQSQVLKKFCFIKPLSFLKIHHQYDEEEEEIIDEQEEQLSMPIVHNTLFYEYQIIYEQKIFKISEEDKKYCNFLQGLIKIHNLLLANCLSETLEKVRVDRVILPWDKKFEPERSINKKPYNRSDFESDLNKIINDICSTAFMRVGEFHKRLEDPDEEKKILKSINQEYKAEGNDWSAQYEYLQLRMEVTKWIQEELLSEVSSDLMIFF